MQLAIGRWPFAFWPKAKSPTANGRETKKETLRPRQVSLSPKRIARTFCFVNHEFLPGGHSLSEKEAVFLH
jgi:hypothetical protein